QISVRRAACHPEWTRFRRPIGRQDGELERSLIVERVKAGLRNAKAKGKRLRRPRVHVDSSRITTLDAQAADGARLHKKGWTKGTVQRALYGERSLSWFAQRRLARFWAGDRGSDFVRATCKRAGAGPNSDPHQCRTNSCSGEEGRCG